MLQALYDQRYKIPNLYDINPDKISDDCYKLSGRTTAAGQTINHVYCRGYKFIRIYPFVEGYSAKYIFIDGDKNEIGSYSGSIPNNSWTADIPVPNNAYFLRVAAYNAYGSGSTSWFYYSIKA